MIGIQKCIAIDTERAVFVFFIWILKREHEIFKRKKVGINVDINYLGTSTFYRVIQCQITEKEYAK